MPDVMSCVARRAVVQIKLQTSVEVFDESFVEKLPLVESAMIAHGLDPARFVIAKDASVSNHGRAFGTAFRDYTVFVDDTHFTVTQPSDMHFLEYFHDCCVAPGNATSPPERESGVVGQLLQWMAKPI
jgi:hypothetical protein